MNLCRSDTFRESFAGRWVKNQFNQRRQNFKYCIWEHHLYARIKYDHHDRTKNAVSI